MLPELLDQIPPQQEIATVGLLRNPLDQRHSLVGHHSPLSLGPMARHGSFSRSWFRVSQPKPFPKIDGDRQRHSPAARRATPGAPRAASTISRDTASGVLLSLASNPLLHEAMSRAARLLAVQTCEASHTVSDLNNPALTPEKINAILGKVLRGELTRSLREQDHGPDLSDGNNVRRIAALESQRDDRRGDG
jgi:hypothetical protein